MYDPIRMIYKNYRGETSERSIVPSGIRWGCNQWHPEHQWILRAWDFEKKDFRDFALKDCKFINEAE